MVRAHFYPPSEITVAALAGSAIEATVIDIREPDAYRRGHIPGAWNLREADVTAGLHTPRGHHLIVVCQSGRRSGLVARYLARTGLARATSLRGGMDAWQGSGQPLARTIWWDADDGP